MSVREMNNVTEVCKLSHVSLSAIRVHQVNMRTHLPRLRSFNLSALYKAATLKKLGPTYFILPHFLTSTQFSKFFIFTSDVAWGVRPLAGLI
jgi:hypothetical protein